MASGGDIAVAETLDGDEPEKFDPYDNENLKYCRTLSLWDNLPSPVFSKIFSHMASITQSQFVHTARQVCPNWLEKIENEIGLKVKIDDRISGNLDFIQNVKVVQARIVNWSENPNTENPSLSFDTFLFQYPNCLQKLVLVGKMPVNWKFQDLTNFPSLSHLILRGAALHSQDLTGSPFPEDSGDNSIYEQYQPIFEPSPIWLKRLKTLEVIMNEFSYPSVLPLSIRLRQPERAAEHERALYRIFFVVVNNVTYILNNLRSFHLSTCQFYIYPKAGIIAPYNINWKHLPLQRFMSNHKHVLKHLYLPEFEGKCDNSEVDILSFPTTLKKLQMTVGRYIGDREENHLQSCTYWQKLLTEQTQIADLDIAFYELSGDWIQETLSSLAFSCKDCLRYVDVIVQAEEPTQLNLESFAFCTHLETLKISSREHDTIVTNFCKLPRSLKKIRLNMCMVEMPDVDLFDKFYALEMLEIFTIMITDQSHGRTVNLLRKVFQLRRLNLLSISFDIAGNTNPELVALSQLINEETEPLYPTFHVRLNLSYEFESGWGDERFDEDKNGVEYIHGREPEEYSARHRNAISVDDEDHRIFIFQTLPFLLDLRGMRHDDDDDDSDESDESTITITDTYGFDDGEPVPEDDGQNEP